MIEQYGKFNQEVSNGFALQQEKVDIGGNTFLAVSPHGTNHDRSTVLLYVAGNSVTNTNVVATLSEISGNGVTLSNLLNSSVDNVVIQLILELSEAFKDESVRGNEYFAEVMANLLSYGNGKFTSSTMFDNGKMKSLLSDENIFETIKTMRDTDATKYNRTLEFIRYFANKLSIKTQPEPTIGRICLANDTRLSVAIEIATTTARLGIQLDIIDTIINMQRLQRTINSMDLISIGAEEKHLITTGVISPAGGGSEITIIKGSAKKKKIVEPNNVAIKDAESIGMVVSISDDGAIHHEINVNLFINVVSTNNKLKNKLPAYMDNVLTTLDKITSFEIDEEDVETNEELILLKQVLERQLLVVPIAVAYGSYSNVTADELMTATVYVPNINGEPDVNALNFMMYLSVTRAIGKSIPVGINRNTFNNASTEVSNTSMVTSVEVTPVDTNTDAGVIHAFYSMGGFYCDPSGTQISKPMRCEVSNGIIYGIDVPVKHIYDTTGIVRDRLNDYPVDFDGFYIRGRTSPLLEEVTKEEYALVYSKGKLLPFTVVGFINELKKNVIYKDEELIDIIRLASLTRSIMSISAIIGLYMGKDVKPCFVTSTDRLLLTVLVEEFNKGNSLSQLLNVDGMLSSIMLTGVISLWERETYQKQFDAVSQNSSVTETYDGGFYYKGFKFHGRDIVLRPLNSLYTVEESFGEMVMTERELDLPTLSLMASKILDSNIDPVKAGFETNTLETIKSDDDTTATSKRVSTVFEDSFMDDTGYISPFKQQKQQTSTSDSGDWLYQ